MWPFWRERPIFIPNWSGLTGMFTTDASAFLYILQCLFALLSGFGAADKRALSWLPSVNSNMAPFLYYSFIMTEYMLLYMFAAIVVQNMAIVKAGLFIFVSVSVVDPSCTSASACAVLSCTASHAHNSAPLAQQRWKRTRMCFS
jgi:hypothetical protein